MRRDLRRALGGTVRAYRFCETDEQLMSLDTARRVKRAWASITKKS